MKTKANNLTLAADAVFMSCHKQASVKIARRYSLNRDWSASG
jgi:hypothetical protein